MSRPSRTMLPFDNVSSPAIRRSSVDLPHPDGPTNTVNWPRAIDRATPLIVFASPNCFWTSFSCRNVRGGFLFFLDGAEREARHELLLAEPAEDDDGGDGEHRGGRQLRPEQA